jgi:hypothetical protein
MTAEIAILNKEAVALAADSAITAGFQDSQKIFGSANKLFALSKSAPVGLMIYGGAQYMDIPWETIIKQYRRKLNDNKHSNLSEYADDFIKYLDGGNDYVPASIQDRYFIQNVTAYFQYVRSKINTGIEKVLIEKKEIEPKEVVQIIKEIIKNFDDIWRKAEAITSLPKNFAEKLKQQYKNEVKKVQEEIFEKLPIGGVESRRINDMAYKPFTKVLRGMSRSNTSGIVIAGFGEKDIFPSVCVYHIDGFVNKRLIYSGRQEMKIDFENSAAVVPFAQQEMVVTFMEGINPDYQNLIAKSLTSLIAEYTKIILDKLESTKTKKVKKQLETKLLKTSEKMLKSLNGQLEEHRRNEFSRPVVAVVSTLPKDELASMAESLVNLTSLKRRVSLQQETVGGPIDVAVISKSDGFVWISRKRYFDKEINPRFFANYNKR